MDKKDKWRIAVLLTAIILLAAAVVILVKKRADVSEHGEETQTSAETQTQEETQESTETQTQEESTESSKTADYPAPDYDFQIEEITIELPGISREYALAWVSDLHLITDKEPAQDVMEEFLESMQTRYETMFVNPTQPEDEVRHSDELLPEIIKYLNYTKIDGRNFDGIIFGGDLLDYCSRSNIDVFKEEYAKLNPDIPKLYIRADHDYGFWYGGNVLTEETAWEMHEEIDGDDLSGKCLEFDDFVIIGVNRSNKDMSQQQYEIIMQQYDNAKQEDKPVIIATHVPYEAYDDSLREYSMMVRNKVYYWTYFSNEGDYKPNDLMGQYFSEVYSADTQVENVLAGHLHAAWDGKISEQVSQHIFAPAFMGFIGVIHVVPSA